MYIDNNGYEKRSWEGLGSIRLVSHDEDGVKKFVLKEEDSDKLSLLEGVRSGSAALCLDTGKVFLYEETDDQWYEME